MRWRAPPPPKFQPLTGLGFFSGCSLCLFLVFLRGFRVRSFRSFRGFRGFRGFSFRSFRAGASGVDEQAGSCHATKRERHQQPHGVGEDLLPRKRAQPQLAGPSGPTRVQFCHSGLGARRTRLLQRHRPDGAEPQAAPDAVRQLGDHGANWFELNKLLSIEKL